MSDKPILFTAPMVRALVAGRKTQTRRVFKLPTKGIYELKNMGGWEPTINGGGGSFTVGRDGTRTPAPETVGIWHQTTGRCLNAPYQAGDRLWARETWRVGWWDNEDGVMAIDFAADGFSDPSKREVTDVEWFNEQWIRISDELDRKGIRPDAEGRHHWARGSSPLAWRPGIHMPRWASRLTLIVTDVRVQRLQEIDDVDALAEGVEATYGESYYQPGVSHRHKYRLLWEALNGLGSWEVDPWVVALTFTVNHYNIDQVAT